MNRQGVFFTGSGEHFRSFWDFPRSTEGGNGRSDVESRMKSHDDEANDS